MRYALIKNGTVRNVIDATPDMAARIGHYTVVQTDDPAVVVGSTYDGSVFSPPTPAAVDNRIDAAEIFSRLNDSEMDTVIDSPAPQAKRFMKLVEARVYIDKSRIRPALVAAFGASRADELLA